jgi:FMN phosphatase YigB (HAD superfamily)
VGLAWSGTLVDREKGLARALEAAGTDPERARRAARLLRPALLELAERDEPYRPWQELLAEALALGAEAGGLSLAPEAVRRAAASTPSWPPFPEAVEALELLSARFPLAVVANGERAVLEAALGAFPFDLGEARLVCSADLESHKPAPDTFLAALHELELDEEELFFLSDDPERDLVTLHDLGVPAGWIRRGAGELPEEVAVSLREPDLLRAARRLTGARGRAPGRRG